MSSSGIPSARIPQASRPSGRLTDQQLSTLLQGIPEARVKKTNNGRSHVEGWDVRRTLIRIFGFGGYETETLELFLVSERFDRQQNATVVYRAQVRLTIKDVHGHPVASWDDAASGYENTGGSDRITLGEAHHNAMTMALTAALKRCAVNLGDQFGLSLYKDGSVLPSVMRSLPHFGGAFPPEIGETLPSVEGSSDESTDGAAGPEEAGLQTRPNEEEDMMIKEGELT